MESSGRLQYDERRFELTDTFNQIAKAISSLAICQASPVGRIATSSVAWATSMPTKTSGLAIISPQMEYPAMTQPC